jgi:phosphotransferase system HPr (HPr) family protein
MKTTQIVVLNPVGLHARPAALFVKLASVFTSEIIWEVGKCEKHSWFTYLWSETRRQNRDKG